MRCFLGLIAVLSACSTTRPCTRGTDLEGYQAKYGGDLHCVQKKSKTGEYINDGSFKALYPNGKIALEGQFKMGKKDGIWSEFDRDGNKLREIRYENGVQK